MERYNDIYVSWKACRDGLTDNVQRMLEEDSTSLNKLDEDGFSPLHYAVRYNRIDVVKLLIFAEAGKLNCVCVCVCARVCVCVRTRA